MLCFILFLVCRIPSRCGPAAREERQSGQPESSPASGQGRCGTGQQAGVAPGECSPLTAPNYNLYNLCKNPAGLQIGGEV